MLIPAICQNDKCKTVFFTPSMVGGNATVTMVDCSVGPCPKCGSTGNIPSGEYSPTGSNIFDPKQWRTLASALTGIRDDILAGASVNEVRQSIANNKTLTAHLAKFAPKDLKDLQTLLIIIGMIFAAYTYLTSQKTPDPKVLLPKPAIQILDAFEQRTEKPVPPPHTSMQQPKMDAASEPSSKSKDNH
jgi:hypothetical protein